MYRDVGEESYVNFARNHGIKNKSETTYNFHSRNKMRNVSYKESVIESENVTNANIMSNRIIRKTNMFYFCLNKINSEDAMCSAEKRKNDLSAIKKVQCQKLPYYANTMTVTTKTVVPNIEINGTKRDLYDPYIISANEKNACTCPYKVYFDASILSKTVIPKWHEQKICSCFLSSQKINAKLEQALKSSNVPKKDSSIGLVSKLKSCLSNISNYGSNCTKKALIRRKRRTGVIDTSSALKWCRSMLCTQSNRWTCGLNRSGDQIKSESKRKTINKDRVAINYTNSVAPLELNCTKQLSQDKQTRQRFRVIDTSSVVKWYRRLLSSQTKQLKKGSKSQNSACRSTNYAIIYVPIKTEECGRVNCIGTCISTYKINFDAEKKKSKSAGKKIIQNSVTYLGAEDIQKVTQAKKPDSYIIRLSNNIHKNIECKCAIQNNVEKISTRIYTAQYGGLNHSESYNNKHDEVKAICIYPKRKVRKGTCLNSKHSQKLRGNDGKKGHKQMPSNCETRLCAKTDEYSAWESAENFNVREKGKCIIKTNSKGKKRSINHDIILKSNGTHYNLESIISKKRGSKLINSSSALKWSQGKLCTYSKQVISNEKILKVKPKFVQRIRFNEIKNDNTVCVNKKNIPKRIYLNNDYSQKESKITELIKSQDEKDNQNLYEYNNAAKNIAKNAELCKVKETVNLYYVTSLMPYCKYLNKKREKPNQFSDKREVLTPLELSVVRSKTKNKNTSLGYNANTLLSLNSMDKKTKRDGKLQDSEPETITLKNKNDQTGEPLFEMKLNAIDMSILNTPETLDKIKLLGKQVTKRGFHCICPSHKHLMAKYIKGSDISCTGRHCYRAKKNKKTNFTCKCLKKRILNCSEVSCKNDLHHLNNSIRTRSNLKNKCECTPLKNELPLLEIHVDRDNMSITNAKETRRKLILFEKALLDGEIICKGGVCKDNANDPKISERYDLEKKQKKRHKVQGFNKRTRHHVLKIIQHLKHKHLSQHNVDNKMYLKKNKSLEVKQTKKQKHAHTIKPQFNRLHCKTRRGRFTKSTHEINLKDMIGKRRKRTKKDFRKERRKNELQIISKNKIAIKKNHEKQMKNKRTKKLLQRIDDKELKALLKKDKKMSKKLKKLKLSERKREIKQKEKELKFIEAQNKGKAEIKETNCLVDLSLGILKMSINIVEKLLFVIWKCITKPRLSLQYAKLRLMDPPETYARLKHWAKATWKVKKMKIENTISGSECLSTVADTMVDSKYYQAFASKGRNEKEKRSIAIENKARKRRMRKRYNMAIYGCRHLLMTTLRHHPCLWVYHVCPGFYPQCLSLLQFYRNMSNLVLFLLAFLFWTPCIVLIEICRAFLCCFSCSA